MFKKHMIATLLAAVVLAGAGLAQAPKSGLLLAKETSKPWTKCEVLQVVPTSVSGQMNIKKGDTILLEGFKFKGEAVTAEKAVKLLLQPETGAYSFKVEGVDGKVKMIEGTIAARDASKDKYFLFDSKSDPMGSWQIPNMSKDASPALLFIPKKAPVREPK